MIAGETVRIPIPLGGTDPDGDSRAAARPGDQPRARRGRGARRRLVRLRGGGVLGGHRHLPVLRGRRARRPVDGHRSGSASRRASTAHATPIAAPDVVTVRPGRTISVRVLENDSDPDGGAPRAALGRSRTLPGATAAIEGDTIAGRGARRRRRLRLHLRDRERGARRGIELPHRASRAATRRSRVPRPPTPC